MKALSIHPLFVMQIYFGLKTIEVRSWKTDYRGDILICSTAKKFPDTIPSHALCVVTLKDIVLMKKKHCEDAMMDPQYYHRGDYAWILDDIRPIKPFPVKGKLHLWECDHEIEFIELTDDIDENTKRVNECLDPLYYEGDKEQW